MVAAFAAGVEEQIPLEDASAAEPAFDEKKEVNGLAAVPTHSLSTHDPLKSTRPLTHPSLTLIAALGMLKKRLPLT